MIAKYLPMSDDLHRYVVEHSSARDDALLEIERETEALGGIAVMQMAPEQGALFTLLVAAMRARFAVEVGTFTGYGAVCIARGLAPGGRLVCCEVDPERAAVARRSLERAGVARPGDRRGRAGDRHPARAAGRRSRSTSRSSMPTSRRTATTSTSCCRGWRRTG